MQDGGLWPGRVGVVTGLLRLERRARSHPETQLESSGEMGGLGCTFLAITLLAMVMVTPPPHPHTLPGGGGLLLPRRLVQDPPDDGGEEEKQGHPFRAGHVRARPLP